jgi:hypothetical protein
MVYYCNRGGFYATWQICHLADAWPCGIMS